MQMSGAALTRATHCPPEDAVALHRAVKSRRSIGMHFGCLAGTADEAAWPVELFHRALDKHDVARDWANEDSFVSIDVGETLSVPV